MDLPPHVELGPHRYEIRSDPDTAQLLRDEDARGDSRPDKLIIRLDPDRTHTAVAETFEALRWNPDLVAFLTADA